MCKILEATCATGIVKVGTLPVPAADILSEGVGSSEGILLLEGDQAKYLAKITPDLKTTLEKLSSAIDTIKSSLSAIDAIGSLVTSCGAGPGTATFPAVNTAHITALATVKTEIDTLKESLK